LLWFSKVFWRLVLVCFTLAGAYGTRALRLGCAFKQDTSELQHTHCNRYCIVQMFDLNLIFCCEGMAALDYSASNLTLITANLLAFRKSGQRTSVLSNHLQEELANS
jgi:hypothetical protein